MYLFHCVADCSEAESKGNGVEAGAGSELCAACSGGGVHGHMLYISSSVEALYVFMYIHTYVHVLCLMGW